MKKFVVMMILAVVFVIVGSQNNLVNANYDHDLNYDEVFTGSGQTTYLYRPSVDVDEYNPPHYTISATLVIVSGYNGTERENRVTLKYNYDTKECFSRQDGRWIEIHPSDQSNASRFNKNLANALFRAAYGMNFYN